MPFIVKADPTYVGQMSRQTDLIAKHLFQVGVPRFRGPFGLRNNPEFFEVWRQNAREAYRGHNELVKRIVPRERLLLFKLEEGWAPLCEFLGKPVPDVPFPRVNEAAALRELANRYIAEGYRRRFVSFMKRALSVLVAVLAISVWWALG